MQLVARRKHAFAKRENALLWANTATSNHNEVLLHDTVVREPTNRGDSLLGDVIISGTVLGTVFRVHAFANSVDLLVHLGTVVVATLTSTRNLVANTSRMPRTNACHLAETTMSLPWQLLGPPASGNTFVPVTFGHANNIDELLRAEHRLDVDVLLKQSVAKINLVGD